MADFITFEQYKKQSNCLKSFFENELNNIRLEMKGISKISDNLFAVMKKYGIKIFHNNSGYTYLTGDWAVEFSIRSRKPINDFTETSAFHFLLVDSFDMAASLSVSSALKTDEHPSEAFYVGTIDTDSHYYAPLNISLLDGLKHHVAIICQHFTETVEEAEKDFCVFSLYVDSYCVAAEKFALDYCNFQDFSTLIFGVDAFEDYPCVDNLVTFDEILVTKNLNEAHLNLPISSLNDKGVNYYLSGDWDLDGVIEMIEKKPPETLNASNNTVFLYKDGVLTFFPTSPSDS